MKILNKPFSSWMRVTIFSAALMVVAPSNALRVSSVADARLSSLSMPVMPTDSADDAPLMRVRGCSVWQPCDRKGNKLPVKRNDAAFMGLLATLSGRY